MNLTREVIISLLNKLLTVLFGYLVLPLMTKGWITEDLGKKIGDSTGAIAGIIAATVLTLLLPVLQGIWNKVVAKSKLLIASASPATTSSADIGHTLDVMTKRKTLEVALEHVAPPQVAPPEVK